jgi:hypothetical protein
MTDVIVSKIDGSVNIRTVATSSISWSLLGVRGIKVDGPDVGEVHVLARCQVRHILDRRGARGRRRLRHR